MLMLFTRPTVSLLRGFAPSIRKMALHQAKSEKLICKFDPIHYSILTVMPT